METKDHFDEIAGRYDSEIPEHIRLHLLRKKTQAMQHQAKQYPAEGRQGYTQSYVKEVKRFSVGQGRWHSRAKAHYASRSQANSTRLSPRAVIRLSISAFSITNGRPSWMVSPP